MKIRPLQSSVDQDAGLVILAAALFTLASCNHPSANAPPSPAASKLRTLIEEGNSAIASMNRATSSRDYDQFFSNYEKLRYCYITAAELLQSEPSLQLDSATKATLAEWESMIETARQRWQELRDPPQPQLPPNVAPIAQQQIEQQANNAAQAWKTKTALWAPMESKLDQAITTVDKLQTK